MNVRPDLRRVADVRERRCDACRVWVDLDDWPKHLLEHHALLAIAADDPVAEEIARG